MSAISRTRVAVLRGGPSQEYEISLKSGSHVLSLLHDMPEEYDPIDVFISKKGDWHKDGLVYEPQRILNNVDVVFNALHGAYGEDGQVQRLLEAHKVPFTGPKALAAALSMNKALTKDIYNQHELKTPRYELLTGNVGYDQLIYIFRNYMHPVIVKPVTGGASIGVRLVHTFNELQEGVIDAFKHADQVMVEEFIVGKEGTCTVVENARGQSLYALMPVEIRLNGKIFDYDSKYSGSVEMVCPGRFKTSEKEMIMEMSKKAHEALGLRHYSRSDFIITPQGNVYILETNSLPGFTENSLIPKALRAAGWKPKEFVQHIISLAV